MLCWLQEVNSDVPDRPASYWSHHLEMKDNVHAKCNFAGKAVKHDAGTTLRIASRGTVATFTNPKGIVNCS